MRFDVRQRYSRRARLPAWVLRPGQSPSGLPAPKGTHGSGRVIRLPPTLNPWFALSVLIVTASPCGLPTRGGYDLPRCALSSRTMFINNSPQPRRSRQRTAQAARATLVSQRSRCPLPCATSDTRYHRAGFRMLVPGIGSGNCDRCSALGLMCLAKSACAISWRDCRPDPGVTRPIRFP